MLVHSATTSGGRIVVRARPGPIPTDRAKLTGLRPEPHAHGGVAGVALYNGNGALVGWVTAAAWSGYGDGAEGTDGSWIGRERHGGETAAAA